LKPQDASSSAQSRLGFYLYTYYERLAQGLRQLMAGSRKFAVDYISRAVARVCRDK
jgi:hypothetical protein